MRGSWSPPPWGPCSLEPSCMNGTVSLPRTPSWQGAGGKGGKAVHSPYPLEWGSAGLGAAKGAGRRGLSYLPGQGGPAAETRQPACLCRKTKPSRREEVEARDGLAEAPEQSPRCPLETTGSCDGCSHTLHGGY